MTKMIKKHGRLIAAAILYMTACYAGGCNTTIRTFDGKARPLQEVAVIRTTDQTCPITRIDTKIIGKDYKAGYEYHLLPGTHTLQVVDVPKDCGDFCRVELVDLEYDFRAGHVYEIPQKKDKADESKAPAFGINSPQTMEQKNMVLLAAQGAAHVQDFTRSEWQPSIIEQGDVITFAAQNPGYFKYSSPWMKLRKENGLAPSIFDILKLSKPKSNEVAQETSIEKF